MSLPNYLSSIKASGMYRFIFDKSEAPAEELEQLRLVVGYSEKGPFNTPVYIESESEFINTFGPVSKKLERKGIFFHRMALQCLRKSPILCLNLKNLDDESVEGLSFNAGELGENITTAVNKIYNTNRFWTLEPEKLNQQNGFNNYINISATDDKSVSNTIFVRSFVPTGYDVTFADWYSQNTNGEEIPEFLIGHENERVQDYFAEVYVFKGEFTSALASSETLNKYFNVKNGVVKVKDVLLNAFGEKIDTLDALASDSNSNFINKYSGILLPEFKNSNNTIISLDAQFNSDNAKHKMMMFFNQDLLWDGDINITDLNTSGYDLVESIENLEEDKIIKIIDVPYEPAIPANPGQEEISHQAKYVATFVKEQTGTQIIEHKETIEVPAVIDYSCTRNGKTDNTAATKFVEWGIIDHLPVEADFTEGVGSSITATYTTSSGVAVIGTWTLVSASDIVEETTEEEVPVYEISIDNITREGEVLQGEALAEAVEKVTVPSIEEFDGGATTQEWEGEGEEDKIIDQEYIAPTEGKDEVPEQSHNEIKEKGTYIILKENAQMFSNNSIKVVYSVGEYNEETGWSFTTPAEFAGDKEPSMLIYKGIEDMDVNDDNLYKLPVSLVNVPLEIGDKIFNEGAVIILSTIKNDGEDKYIGFVNAEDGEAYTETIKGSFNLFVHSFGDKIYSDMDVTYLKGYSYNGGYEDFIEEKHYDKNTMWSKLQWHKSILSVLTKWKGLRIGLTSRVDSEWRYLVDTFEAYVETGIHAELSNIAKTKQNAFAILNFPSVSALQKCEYTSFVDEDGLVQIKYLPEGGNRQKPMSTKLALPTEFDGAVFSGFFTPVVISENGSKKTIPSAALVSNLFVDKLENRYAYSFVAGPNYAKIVCDGLIGPEFNFDKDELGILETMGVNAIVYIPNKGTFINSNKTAKQNPVSALSYINVIELSIFLQDEIENMLQNYQWERNTAELRGTVKGRADKICELIQNNGGIKRFYNQCDDKNNTEDVSNNEMFIIDTSIEPGMGCGKMVQTLTIYRQGGMKAVFGE